MTTTSSLPSVPPNAAVPVLPNGKTRDRPMDDHPFAVHDPLAAVFFYPPTGPGGHRMSMLFCLRFPGTWPTNLELLAHQCFASAAVPPKKGRAKLTFLVLLN